MIDNFADCANEGDYFLKFIDAEIRQNILYQTTLYVAQKHRRVPIVTANEFYMPSWESILMGYLSLATIKHYWSSYVDLKIPLVSDAMPRNRYQQILVNDNSAMPENKTDKMYKIRPFVDTLNNNFMLLCDVIEHITVGEGMILFKGRSLMKQYNPMKPIKRCYKIWATADMNGYMSKFSINKGKIR